MVISDKDFLSMEQVLQKIKEAAENRQPFSLVRIGDGENLVLAQDSVWTVGQVITHTWGSYAVNPRNSKGITLPNLAIRDQMVSSLKKATIAGILPNNDRRIGAPDSIKRPLTNKVFSYFDIKPQAVCDAYMTRLFPKRREFWDILKQRRILLISRWANGLKPILEKAPYGLNVTLTVPFTHYIQMKPTLEFIDKNKDNFDIALVSCGVNAVILSQQVAELTGNIGIDFGKSSKFMVQGKTGLHII